MMRDYKSKFGSPEEVAEKAVWSGDWVDYGFGGGFPELMEKALAKRKGKVKDVKIGLAWLSGPRTMIQYVATEYGVVKLSGLSLRERAVAMTSIAHPNF